MGKPWAELSSGERLDAIPLAVDAIERRQTNVHDATAAGIAMVVQREHVMTHPKHGKSGKGNGSRAMSEATRVTPGITALRRRLLLSMAMRSDGKSGTADVLTALGEERVAMARQLAGCTKDEYRVVLACMGQIPMPSAPERAIQRLVTRGKKKHDWDLIRDRQRRGLEDDGSHGAY